MCSLDPRQFSGTTPSELRVITLAVRLALGMLVISGAAVAQEFDQKINTDRTTTVRLTKPGTTVLVEAGVTITTGKDEAMVGEAGDTWAITNRGTIQAQGETAVRLNGPGSVTNEGVISGSNGIFGIDGLRVRNTSGARIDGYTGVGGSGPVQLDNAGIIDGQFNGVAFSLPNHGDGADIVNSGEIRGGYTGIRLTSGSTATVSSSLHNLPGGKILGTLSSGDGIMVLHGTSVVKNDADATIEGRRSGIAGIDLFTDLHVINAGTVKGGGAAGIWSYGGGPISNLAGGYIGGAGGVAYVRSIFNVNNVLFNAGTIEGNGTHFITGTGKDAGSATGVYIGEVYQPSDTVIQNDASGSIKGTAYGIYSRGSLAESYAGSGNLTRRESDAGRVIVSNSGTIEGHTGIALNGVDGDVFNSGIIVGRGGNAIEFDQFNPFSNTLTLDTGSVLVGDVLGGAGSNTLVLKGRNTEDLSKFHNMQRLSMQGEDWTLKGIGGFTKGTSVTNGRLFVDGSLTSPTVVVDRDGTLSGSGTIVGDVRNAGTLAPGSQGGPAGTLTIDGDLTLTRSSVLEYRLGQAGTAGGALNDLTEVSGNLVLDGTLNVSVSEGGTFGPGLYRLFNYGGTLTDKGLVLGRTPEGSDNKVMTAVPGQVNLVNRAGLNLTFWDGDAGPKYNGAADGGDGVWQAASGNNNWTDAAGAVNDAYASGSFATFTGTAGVVTVDNSLGDVLSSGMQFATDGYRIQGDPISLAPINNILRVGDGTSAGAGFTATIASVLRGTGGIEKTDLGTLVLAGANSYSGDTTISKGTLQAGAINVFAASRQVSVNRAGTLDLNDHDQIANRLSGEGNVRLGSATLTANNASNAESSSFKGTFSGAGTLVKTGAGALGLAGAGSKIGAVEVREGTLRFEHGGAFVTTGDFTTFGGATTDIGAQGTALVVGGKFSLAAGSNLGITLGASPDITAQTAELAGTLSIRGFDAGSTPVRASAVQDKAYTVLRTTGGITGEFANSPLQHVGPDYLPAIGAVSADGKDYTLGFRLAWTQGGQALGTGNFTMAADTAFDVDVALANQTGSFASGWDGKSLTKSGQGVLVLSNAGNTYSGSTTVKEGVLRAGADNVFMGSSDVVIHRGATLDLDGHQQLANRLTGAGAITLGSAVLTAKNATEADSSEFSGAISGSGGLTKTGAGTLTLSGATQYTGDTRVDSGSLVLDGRRGGARLRSNILGLPGSALQLRGGAQLTGSAQSLDVSVDAASSWAITSSSVVGKLSNAGKIGFTAPPLPMSATRSLTVSNLNGQGGSIDLYAVLGSNNSLTDRIVIDGGTATGLSLLHIHNAGGLGDLTTGAGIPVVITSNGGTTEASAFALGRPVLAGPYRYNLRRGGNGSPEAWFLVSGRDGAGGVRPDYRAETSLYSVLPGQALRYGDAVLGTYHERRGINADLGLGQDQRVWMRAIAQNDRTRGAGNGLQGRSVRNEANSTALQIGGDFYGSQSGDSSMRAGLYGAIGQSKGWSDHVDAASTRARAGDNDFTGHSLGLYGTWLDGHGGYLDAVLQGTYYGSKSRSKEGMKLSSGGYGVAASLEAGRRYELTPGLNLQPQAQMVFQHLNLRDGSDAASRVTFPNTNTALLRVGARLNKDLQGPDQVPGTAWVGTDLLQRVGDRTRTRFSTPSQGDVGFSNDLPRTALRLQTGVEGQVLKNVTINAHIGLEKSFDGSGLTSFNGQVGLNVAF
ncbi:MULTISPECIES: autotransporter outer membrane beta-barrel domain-containing protein [Pseudomonas]|uniref:autotransporter outer membrane beta-barrel domain-containing protein n=1 Tax=Pseudomonas TaxID=286 RepID=UPI0023604F78|nr:MULTISPECIES: autotransporter outer membrane beta-barrel domain-containing protein [Pseudomonas]WJV25492.1 autotransporter outer membrane beta-barrel domain-containing protein [Pseudomonas chlororaphis]